MLVSDSPSIAFACMASVALSNIAQAAVTPNNWASIKYSTVVGFFAQDLPGTDDSSFDYVCGGLHNKMARWSPLTTYQMTDFEQLWSLG